MSICKTTSRPISYVIRSAFACSLFALFVPSVSGQVQSLRDNGDQPPRPIAPYRSATEQWQSYIRMYERQLDEKRLAQQRLDQWFDENKQPLRETKDSLKQLLEKNQSYATAWNDRRNPTCTQRLTYATCTCAAGARGKAYFREQWVGAYNAASAKQRECVRLVDSWNQRVDSWNSLINEVRQIKSNLDFARSQSSRVRDQEGLRVDDNATRPSLPR